MDWLSTYNAEEELAGSYNMVEKTIHKRIWEYALANPISISSANQDRNFVDESRIDEIFC